MYKVLTACIDQVIRFNNLKELERFLDGLDARKQQYKFISKTVLPDGSIIVRIQRQYNNSPMPE
jgi:hypothetical protein